MARRRANPETQLQRSLVQHLRIRAWPDVFWYAVPNGGWRTPAEAGILKATGVRAGVPDMAFLRNGAAYYLELKAPGGRPTENQLQCISEINAAGGFACVAEGFDAALNTLETWGLLRGVSK